MVAEGNVIADPAANALEHVLGVAPTPLDTGLGRLLDTLPEQLPEEGLGALHHKRYWARVEAPRAGAAELFATFCGRFRSSRPTRWTWARSRARGRRCSRCTRR
jgi:NADH dehydrogenase